MNQLDQSTGTSIPTSSNVIPESSKILPGYHKCLSCEDLGNTCNGPSLRSLGDITAVRTYHKALRKIRKVSLHSIADVTPQISESSINEYFSNSDRDYKWTTVSQIDNALLAICGNRIGLPPLDHACPASSSEVRQQMAAADLKLAAAELRAAQSEGDVTELRRKIAENKAKHIEQIEMLQRQQEKNTDWYKEDIRLWRRISLVSLGICLALLLLLLAYIAWTHLR